MSIRSDDLDGLTTGQRIQILRERKGLTRPVLAGLVGKVRGPRAEGVPFVKS